MSVKDAHDLGEAEMKAALIRMSTAQTGTQLANKSAAGLRIRSAAPRVINKQSNGKRTPKVEVEESGARRETQANFARHDLISVGADLVSVSANETDSGTGEGKRIVASAERRTAAKSKKQSSDVLQFSTQFLPASSSLTERSRERQVLSSLRNTNALLRAMLDSKEPGKEQQPPQGSPRLQCKTGALESSCHWSHLPTAAGERGSTCSRNQEELQREVSDMKKNIENLGQACADKDMQLNYLEIQLRMSHERLREMEHERVSPSFCIHNHDDG